MTNLMGVALRGLSGHIRDLSNLGGYFLCFLFLCLFVSFFLSFFSFLRHAHRSHFLTDRDDLYVKTRVSAKDVPRGVSTICDHI